MVEIKPTESTRVFASPVLFERTGNIREKLVECSREELIDYSAACHEMLEAFQGQSERTNRELELFLGWMETL